VNSHEEKTPSAWFSLLELKPTINIPAQMIGHANVGGAIQNCYAIVVFPGLEFFLFN
jgi:hypothetical protein